MSEKQSGAPLRVVAALSGGVDSAVAAARAVAAGHEVTGVHLALSRSAETQRTGARGCCTLEDSRDARRVADVLGIPYYIWDLSEQFQEQVIDDFLQEYAAGRTPNPCVRCNETIKFAAVLERAVALGFDALVTGHYARISQAPDGTACISRAVDPAKDQSYVLGVLTPDQVARSIFPLGDSTKSQVRKEAEQRGLLVADKPDSHDVCFIPDGDTAGFLRGHLGEQPGAVLDTEGRTVGTHDGAFAFTVGQRRGLALSEPAADGRPRFVLSIEPVSSTVVVGPHEMLSVDAIELTNGPTWRIGEDLRVRVQWRAHGEAVPAQVVLTHEGRVDEVLLDESAHGVAAGQELVAYDGERGERVIFSARIAGSRRRSR